MGHFLFIIILNRAVLFDNLQSKQHRSVLRKSLFRRLRFVLAPVMFPTNLLTLSQRIRIYTIERIQILGFDGINTMLFC